MRCREEGDVQTPWTVKHKPRRLAEVVGNQTAFQKLEKWIKSWEKAVPKKRAAFLYGPPGVGKTLSVEVLANELNLDLVEKNASDYRTADAVKRFAGRASQYTTLTGKKRLILLDEMDGITGTVDKGGVRIVTEITKTSRSPLVLIANNAYDPRFSILRSYCLLIKFEKPTFYEVLRRLKEICLKEGIQAEADVLKAIAKKAKGDIRSAVNDLQALAQGKKRLTHQDVAWLAGRDRKDIIFNVLKTVFYAKNCLEAKSAVDAADVELDMLFEWIYENAPHHLKDPHELAKGMDALAVADIYRGRIRSTRNWKFMRYVIDFMTAGITFSKEGPERGWTPFKFPARIKWLSRTRKNRKMRSLMGLKIGKKCHLSSSAATKEVLPFLRIIFESNTKMATGLAEWFDLDDSMVTYLAERHGL